MADPDQPDKSAVRRRRLLGVVQIVLGLAAIAAVAALFVEKLIHPLPSDTGKGSDSLSVSLLYKTVAPLLFGVLLILVGLYNWRRGRRRRLGAVSVFRLAALVVIYAASLGAATIYFAVNEINSDLPKDLTALLDYQPNRKSLVFSSDGQ